MQKNAKQHVQDVTGHLQDAKNCLNNALSSVEKAENRQQIQNTLTSVDSAMQAATNTLKNYKE
ncbi:MAG TPA: EscE/YscE/SsaE family type III secretion system needle protein co-chaperone [Clostridiaceae bacterium]